MKCERCGNTKHLTEHHILPRRWFGGAGPKCILCRRCHDELERRINLMEKQILHRSESWYIELCRKFCVE